VRVGACHGAGAAAVGILKALVTLPPIYLRPVMDGVGQVQSVAVRAGPRRVSAAFADSARVHAPIAWFIFAYAVCGLVLSTFFGQAGESWPLLYVGFFLSKSLLLLLFYVFARLLHAMIVVRPQRLFEHLWRDFTANPEVHRQLAAGIPLVILLPLFLSVFASLKVLIPEINPFGWDAAFADWDRLLHFGFDPWRILQPVIGHPFVTFLFDLVYCAWFYLLQLVCIWQAFSVSRPRPRMQFFLSFLLVWVLLGNVGATLLSSAGPVFYANVAGSPGAYQPLLDYLQDVAQQFPLWSPGMQQVLWHNYLHPEVSITRGISAMPSIHVAMAFLMALLGWRIHRALGVALTAYVVAILIASVHLGWHYAIDGYAGIIGTYAIWRAVGWALARRDGREIVPSSALAQR
jgi:hypothetical protein